MTTPTRRKTRRSKVRRKSAVVATHLSFVNAIGQLQTVVAEADLLSRRRVPMIPFDASWVPGLQLVEEGTMALRPHLPGARHLLLEDQAAVVRVPCDLVSPDGRPSGSCPRQTLERAMAALAAAGLSLEIAAELEFFLFARRDPDHCEPRQPQDAATRFAEAPVDQAAAARKAIAESLGQGGFALIAARPGGAPGRHRLQLRGMDPRTLADDLPMVRQVICQTAARSGLAATFMPRPVQGRPGAGLPLRLRLTTLDGTGLVDEGAEGGLGTVACNFIAGLLLHARALCALTSPLVNSYKRLLGGGETPTHVAWSTRLRGAFVRAGLGQAQDLLLDLSVADANLAPHIAFAGILHAGLHGIRVGQPLPAAVHVSADLPGLLTLPGSLQDALLAFLGDHVLRDALGSGLSDAYLQQQQLQWTEFAAHVTDWELQRGLAGC